MTFASCEKTVKLNIPPYTPTLVLNCIPYAGEYINASVGYSESIANHVGVSKDLSLDGATVLLYTNGVLTDTLVYDTMEYRYKSTTVAEVGKTYELRVSAPTYTAISASSNTPQAVLIDSALLTRNVRKDPDGNMQDMITLKFNEPATANDYYILRIKTAGSVLQGQYMERFCVYTADANVETANNDFADLNECIDNDGLYLRDDLINGQRKELKLYLSSGLTQGVEHLSDTVYYFVELSHVTEQGFKYERSYRTARDSNGDPFAEPSNVYSNVKNGHGIFHIVNTSVALVK